MQIRVETIAEVKNIRFAKLDSVLCAETGKEYLLVENGALTPDDDDYIQAVHGANFRYVAMSALGSGGGGGGGGGSAYPDAFQIVTANKTLTDADQGLIYQAAGTLRLPATAADGETYKLIGKPGDLRINTNGNLVIGLGVSATTDAADDFRLGGGLVTLVAVNSGGNLVWAITNRPEIVTYNSARTYYQGQIVVTGNTRYLCIADGVTGQDLNDPVYWLSLGGPSITSGTIDFSDLSFTASSAPTGLALGSYKITRAGKLAMLDIYLSLTGASTGVTAVYIGITKASEIRDALVDATEDIFGTGHAMSNSGFGAAAALTAAMYSPTNLEYIAAKMASVNNLSEVRMQFIFGHG